MIITRKAAFKGVLVALTVAAVLIAGCTSFTSSNPVAQAGADQKVRAGTVVTLDGTGSSAPGGGALIYDWSFSSVPKESVVSLANNTSARPNFTPDKAGTYVVSLVVKDSAGKVSAPDMTNVTAISGERVATKLTDIQASKTDNLYLGDQVVTTGRLVDADGNGIPNQTITFRAIAHVPLLGSRDVSQGSVTTDSTGAFRKVNDPVSGSSFINTLTVEGWIEYAGNDVYQPTSTSHHQVTVHLTAPPSS
jgi:PKD repeat protein